MECKGKIVLASIIFLIIGGLAGSLGEELAEEVFEWEDDDENDEMLLSFITDDPYPLELDPADFVEGINHSFFPMAVGSAWVFEAETEDGLERIEVEVLNDTRTVLGIECTIVRDTVYMDGDMIEDTWDWYAQDIYGNVWYMGEDTAEYENGVLLNHNGAWDPDKDGSLPGIYMWGNPIVGTTYRQEYLKGEAEDWGTVMSLGNTVTIGYGTYNDVLITKDFIPGEPDGSALKYYAPGIGVILEEEEDERVELIEMTKV